MPYQLKTPSPALSWRKQSSLNQERENVQRFILISKCSRYRSTGLNIVFSVLRLLWRLWKARGRRRQLTSIFLIRLSFPSGQHPQRQEVSKKTGYNSYAFNAFPNFSVVAQISTRKAGKGKSQRGTPKRLIQIIKVHMSGKRRWGGISLVSVLGYGSMG